MFFSCASSPNTILGSSIYYSTRHTVFLCVFQFLCFPVPRFVGFFFHRTSPNAKVCGFLLPQDLSQCQGLWVSSSTGLLPMPRFVGFFFHRTSPNAKVCGFL